MVVATSKVFYVIYDIKLLYRFDIIKKCLSDVKQNDHFPKFTENDKGVYLVSNV